MGLLQIEVPGGSELLLVFYEHFLCVNKLNNNIALARDYCIVDLF